MRRAAKLAFAVAACSTVAEDPPPDVNDLCNAEVHCHVDESGTPVCDDGYEWVDPADPTDYRCQLATGCTPGTNGCACRAAGAACDEGLVCGGGGVCFPDTCGCNTDGQCQAACTCDPDCGVGCECDVSDACDAPCACDPEC